ncbi:cyclase [Heliobacterium gestii]|uniref:Cyclase n=1 Tax=Heliomicrobium gestii TaxID=2699 RepID=A0A845L694_HELGE|nr:aromatase/cyclase [Heliomicrobium gestii]MBM7865476.1 ribosome-associated toxin RatA of RatAB toxin-antitoxin module [Heliomicrobium gestii]MZP41728.1 cyclase [Heliomicrobium gestii]
MPYVEESLWIGGSVRSVYALACRMEDYPLFMSDVRSVCVVERGEGYTVTDWETDADGRLFRWRERDDFLPDEGRIIYRQIEGDVKRFEGEWRFREQGEGCEVTLTVDFDLGIPMLAPLLHPILVKKVRENSRAMLFAIKEKVEG